jgi:hypothetical protein
VCVYILCSFLFVCFFTNAVTLVAYLAVQEKLHRYRATKEVSEEYVVCACNDKRAVWSDGTRSLRSAINTVTLMDRKFTLLLSIKTN